MEDRDFAWVCATLSAVEARVAVPETVFFTKGEVALWVYASPKGVLRRRVFMDNLAPTPTQVFQHFEAMHSQESPSNPTICLVSAKGSLIALTEDRLEEAKAQRGAFSRCVYVQFPLESQSPALLYAIRLDLWEGNYRCSFTRKSTRRDCGDQRMYAKLMAYVRVVLRTLESCRKRAVERIELEFFVGENGEVWLCSCPLCQFGPSYSHMQHKSVNSLSSDDPRWIDSSSKGRKLQPRVCTPQQFLSAANPTVWPIPPPLPSRPASKPALNPRTNSQSLVLLPPSRSGRLKSTGFYHPNFIEILAKGYARTNKWLSDDFEMIFRDMDSKLLKTEESPLKQLSKTHTHRQDSLQIDSIEADFGHISDLKAEQTAEISTRILHRHKTTRLPSSGRVLGWAKPFRLRRFEPLLHRKGESATQVRVSRRYNFTLVKD